MRSYRNPLDGANLPQASPFLPISTSPPRGLILASPLDAALGAMPIGVHGATVGGRGVRDLQRGTMGAMPIGVDGATVGVGGATVGRRGIRGRGA